MLQRDKSRKWLICDPLTPVGEIAFIALADRLGCIADLLANAAFESEHDIEHVHRLRVATRRADVALQLFAPFADSRPAKRIASHLSEIRKAAGRARDLDVWIERSRARKRTKQVKSLVRKRKRAQERIKRAHEDFVSSGKVKKHTLRLLHSMPQEDDPAGSVPLGAWAHILLRSRIGAFLSTWPKDTVDLDVLHRFRIQSKGLRYVVELVACAFPNELRENLYPHIEGLQDALGRINDHAVACRKLEGWIAKKGAADVDALQTELADERVGLRVARAVFADQWTSDARHQLESAFRKIVS